MDQSPSSSSNQGSGSTESQTELEENTLNLVDTPTPFQVDPQPKNLEFERYLQVGGVFIAITRALYALNNDPIKPNDPLEYLVSKMSERLPQIHEGMEVLYKEMIDLIIKLEELIPENQRLKRELLLRETLKDIEENPGEDGGTDD